MIHVEYLRNAFYSLRLTRDLHIKLSVHGVMIIVVRKLMSRVQILDEAVNVTLMPLGKVWILSSSYG